MHNKYELKGPDSRGFYTIFVNKTPVLSPTTKELAKEYIKEYKKEDEKIRKLNKEFVISSICREDLEEYIGIEQALELNNTQIQNIADKMHDYHMYVYWDDLDNILHDLGIRTTKNINN